MHSPAPQLHAVDRQDARQRLLFNLTLAVSILAALLLIGLDG